MDNNLERWYSMKEIMEYLGVSRDTVLDWIERRGMPAVSKFLLYICKYSFPLYLLHTFFTAAARIFLLKLGIANFAVQLCVGTAAGILLPLVCAKIAERSPYLEILFYPKKGYSEIRSRKKAAHLAGRER